MTVKYGFYDSLNGDRLYNANDVSTMFEGLFSDGVFEFVGNCLRVEPNIGSMGVLVNDGRAWFNNLWIRNTSKLYLDIEPSHLVLDRIDLVVLDFDFGITVRQNSIKVLTGIPSTSPIPPILANTLTNKQYALAEIYVAASTSQLLTTDIIDKVGTVYTPYATSLINEVLPTVREVLTASRTYYIRKDGNDTNSGLVDSPSGAFLTAEKMRSTLAGIDKNGFGVVAKFGVGTWLENLTPSTGIGEGGVIWRGTLVEKATITGAIISPGGNAIQGTVTKIGAFTSLNYTNLWVYFVTDAVYRVIDSHTNDVLTLVGTAPSATSQDIIIYDQGTIFSSLTITNTVLNIESISVTGNVRATGVSSYYISYSKLLTDIIAQRNSLVGLLYSVVHPTGAGQVMLATTKATISVDYSKMSLAHTSAYNRIEFGGNIQFRNGSIIDGNDGIGGKATYGFQVRYTGSLDISGGGGGYTVIRNCDNGVFWSAQGFVTGLNGVTFSGNTTNVYQNDGVTILARVSSQFDKISSTSLSDITGLALNLTAGVTYQFEACLYTVSNIAGGVQASISGTATATNIIYECQTYNGAVLAAASRATALNTVVGAVTAVTTATMIIRGTITVNTAGTLIIRFAQNVSNAIASSVLLNSTLRAWAMP